MKNIKSYIQPLVVLSLMKYFDSKGIDDFEKKMNSYDGRTDLVNKKEVKYVLNHFRKQIYPVDKKVLKWMFNANPKMFNFNDEYKKLKKLMK